MIDENEPVKRNYDYLQDMSVEGWTWEFIRRNPAYRKAWREHGLKSKIEAGAEDFTEVSKKESAAASCFGLLFFRRSSKEF
jgi:hypothetical protein